MTRVFINQDDPELITMIRAGAVGIAPTDTVYGVVAAADNPTAVSKLYALKKRESKPGTTIAASTEQLKILGIDASLLARVEHFWPAPLSIVMPQGEALNYLHQGVGNSPFRVVANQSTQQFLLKTGPLLTSSANQPGEPPAVNLAEAQSYFGDQVDFYVDGGDIGERLPSTIASLQANGTLHILRQGAAIIPEGDQS